ncbi:MAG: SIMPL domain-containing protein [Pseudomonadota bacterium]
MRWLILAFLFAAGPLGAEDRERVINVSGEGIVTATPDMAELTIGVTRRNRRPDAAMAAVAEGVASVFGALDEAGIEARDRRTASVSLRPEFERTNTGSPRITGYQASNQITVRVRDLSLLGGLMTATVGDGANGLSGLQFVLSDPAPLREEARRLAVADAMGKAALFADAAGVSLGPLLTLSDDGGFVPQSGPVFAESDFARSTSMPVAEGELDVRANVSMVYAIGE